MPLRICFAWNVTCVIRTFAHWSAETANTTWKDWLVRKLTFSKGVLALADLQKLERLLGADELFQLTQEKIVMPMITVDNDKLLLSVLRPGYWQNLTYLTPKAESPFSNHWFPSSNGSRKWKSKSTCASRRRVPEITACHREKSS